eukprot:2753474-Pleurochrysis_carterae.AAC.1
MVRTNAHNKPIGRLEETVMRNTVGSKCPESSERGSQRLRRRLHTNLRRYRHLLRRGRIGRQGYPIQTTHAFIWR